VTHHQVKALEDGTRVYSNRTRYTPVPEGQRKYRVRKPPEAAEEGWERWKGDWLPPIPLLPAEARSWPETRPDTDAYDHASKGRCRCQPCLRPTAAKWRAKWKRDQPRS
jgi:hypothetical protein